MKNDKDLAYIRISKSDKLYLDLYFNPAYNEIVVTELQLSALLYKIDKLKNMLQEAGKNKFGW